MFQELSWVSWALDAALPRNSVDHSTPYQETPLSQTGVVLEAVPTAVVLQGSSRTGKSWIQTLQQKWVMEDSNLTLSSLNLFFEADDPQSPT